MAKNKGLAKAERVAARRIERCLANLGKVAFDLVKEGGEQYSLIFLGPSPLPAAIAKLHGATGRLGELVVEVAQAASTVIAPLT